MNIAPVGNLAQAKTFKNRMNEHAHDRDIVRDNHIVFNKTCVQNMPVKVGNVESLTKNIISNILLKAKSLVAGENIFLNGKTEIKGDVKAGIGLWLYGEIRAKSLSAKGSIFFDKAEIKDDINAGRDIKAYGELSAKSLNAGDSMYFDDKVNIKGDIKAGADIFAYNELNANSLSAGRNIRLNAINKLESITLTAKRTSKTTNLYPILTLTSNDIKPKKIKVYLGDYSKLYVETLDGSGDILKHFEFIDAKTGNIISDYSENIIVSKIFP